MNTKKAAGCEDPGIIAKAQSYIKLALVILYQMFTKKIPGAVDLKNGKATEQNVKWQANSQEVPNILDELEARVLQVNQYIRRTRLLSATIENLKFEKAACFMNLAKTKELLKKSLDENKILIHRVTKLTERLQKSCKNNASSNVMQTFPLVVIIIFILLLSILLFFFYDGIMHPILIH